MRFEDSWRHISVCFWDTVRKSRHTDKWRPKNRTTAAIVGVVRPNKTGCVVDCSMNIWRVWTWWLQNKWTTVIIVENTASRSSWLSECTVDLCCTPVYVCRGRIDTVWRCYQYSFSLILCDASCRVLCSPGARFTKNLTTNVGKT